MTITQKEILNHEATQFAILLHAYYECSPEVQEIVRDMSEIIVDKDADVDEKMHAADALVEALLPSLTAEVRETDELQMTSESAQAARAQLDDDESVFADRLAAMMKARNLTQEQLANLTGVGQPAISNMLARRCRPQRRTVLRFAEALGVDASELWPIG